MKQPRDLIGRFAEHRRSQPELALTPEVEYAQVMVQFERETRQLRDLQERINQHRAAIARRVGGGVTVRPILTDQQFEITLDYDDGGVSRLLTDGEGWQHETLVASGQVVAALNRIIPGDATCEALLADSQRLQRTIHRRWGLHERALQLGGEGLIL